MNPLRLLLAVAALALTARAADFARPLPTPAAADSQCANLVAAPDGTLYLTWYGPGGRAGERALKLATLAPGRAEWSAPHSVVSTPLLMENWADFASLAVGTDGALTAQWFQKPDGPEARGYDGWYSRSHDGGRTWRAPARLGHEFVALAPLSGGRTLAVWLESTRFHDRHAPRPSGNPPSATRHPQSPAPYAPSMKLLARLLAPDGSPLREWTVDPDVCTCCQNTAAVLPGDRVFVGYRGHTAEEIRDNKYSVFDLAAGTWSAPATLKDDGWKIAACPVNGPAADSRGNALAVAWFTAADGVARVQARASSDAGRTFGAPVQVDLGRPLGRIETVMLADGSAAILWLEVGDAENVAGIYARRLWADGTLSEARLVATSSQARASGFPRAARRPDGRIVMAWTQAGDPNQVRLLDFDPAQLVRPGKLAAAPAIIRRGPPPILELCESPVTVNRLASQP